MFISLVLSGFLASLAAADMPAPDSLRDGYRDATGNLIVTYARKVRDQSSGEVLGILYCDPKRCTELATQYDRRRDGGPYVRFDFAGGGHGDLLLQPWAGSYKLACVNGISGDLRPVSKDDVAKIGDQLKSGKLDFTPAPEVHVPVFIGKSASTGRYVYLDTDTNQNERLFLGKPGEMEQKNFRQKAMSCDAVGCIRVLETGGVLGMLGSAGGWGATRVQIERFAGAIDRDLVKKVRPDAPEVAALKIPGATDPNQINARNPCLPTGPNTTAPTSTPAPSPTPSAPASSAH